MVAANNRKTVVYCIRSTAAPLRFYFGLTERPGVRLRQHISHAKRGARGKFPSAIRKYGADTFSLTVLGEFNSRQEAASAEREIICAYGGNGSPILWNATTGGDGGYEHFDEVRKVIGQKVRDAYENPELRKKRSAISKRLWAVDGARERHSETIKELCKNKDYMADRVARFVESRGRIDARLRNSSFVKGVSVADPGDIVVFLGVDEAKKSGFDNSGVSKSILGRRDAFKGRRWTRITTEEGLALRPDLLKQLQEEKGTQCR